MHLRCIADSLRLYGNQPLSYIACQYDVNLYLVFKLLSSICLVSDFGQMWPVFLMNLAYKSGGDLAALVPYVSKFELCFDYILANSKV